MPVVRVRVDKAGRVLWIGAPQGMRVEVSEASVPPWDESRRPEWSKPGTSWLAPTRRWPPYGPESDGDPREPVWGAGCGVDD